MRATAHTRFDARLPIEQKKFFEYAANLGGFRTLTEFIIYSAQQQATTIVEKQNTILASNKDRELFFKALLNPAKPNKELKKAAARFKKISNSKWTIWLYH